MLSRSGSMLGRTTLGLAAVLCLALAASPAAASGKGEPQITAYAGGYFGGQIYTGYSGTAGNIDVGDSFDWGLQLAYVFRHAIGLEFTYGDNSGSLNYHNPYALQAGTLGDLGEQRFEFDVNFYTHPNKVVGYFALGAGWTDYKLTPTRPAAGYTGDYKDSKFTSNVGLGALIYMKPNVALRVDGRWRYTDTNTGSTAIYCDFYGYCYAYDNSYYGSGSLTGGITFFPGKK